MEQKIRKILKAELFTLFLATVLAFISFYYRESLPDNYYSISSESGGLSFLSYYLTSGVAIVGQYTGPWIFFPFIIFSIFYTFQFVKRSYVFDIFNVLSLVLASLLLSHLFSVQLVGEGLAFYIDKFLTPFSIGFSGMFFALAFLAGSFRESFKASVFQVAYFCSLLPGFILKGLLLLNPVKWWKNYKFYRQHFESKMRLRIPQMLQGLANKKEEEKSQPQLDWTKKGVKEKDKGQKESDAPSPFQTRMMGPEENEESSAEPKATPVAEKATDKFKDLVSKKKPEAPENTEVESIDTSTATTEGQVEPNYMAQRNQAVKEEKSQNESRYYEILNSISPFKKADDASAGPDEAYFSDIVERIESKLQEFNIEGQIVNVLKGPVVDTFELELGPGVKVSKVNNAEDDLSMALFGAPVRIVYPMIGRTTVGIEVPRKPREVIYLEEVLNSDSYSNKSYQLPIAMGKNAFGETFVVDLASMPHMLIAGATGAGKSVFINTLLVSLLVKKSPQQMKLILIDPKQLELAQYANLPHLALPVVTDPKIAAISLVWATQEMERRYSILKDMGVRNIEGFNEKLKRATPEQLAKIHQYYENPDEEGYELPYIVIIIDEFADLILTKAGKEIEQNISRLAAKARAAGIHLVLATQRPSVDVITGVIKSNFPTRVSFRVTGVNDSRTILDGKGAEKLLGKGDMLYKHGTNNYRLHSAFVDEEEVEYLTDSLSELPGNYSQAAMDFIENGGEQNDDPFAFGSNISSVISGEGKGKDEKYNEAVQIVTESGMASASMLQRKLNVGYNRASNLIDELEANGVVGPPRGSKPRKVIASSGGDQA